MILLLLFLLLLLCLFLTSRQQLRSYGDGATAKSLNRQTGEAGDRTCYPWFTRQVAYSLHHSDSYHDLVKSCMFLEKKCMAHFMESPHGRDV